MRCYKEHQHTHTTEASATSTLGAVAAETEFMPGSAQGEYVWGDHVVFTTGMFKGIHFNADGGHWGQ